MSKRNDMRRVLLAVTEATPLAEVWRATVELLEGAPAELIAMLVTDDRWRRAASLSFTREISRVGGASADFTRERAEQVDKEALAAIRRQIQQLAADSELRLVFDVLSEHDPTGIDRLMEFADLVLVAPSHITSRPIYSEFTRLNCQILLIEAPEEQGQTGDPESK